MGNHSPCKGVVFPLHGREIDAGNFMLRMCWKQSLPPQLEKSCKSGEDKYAVLILGLHARRNSSNPM
ncbi:hypothetical protein SAY87_001326 [Trapa incisa]|uniref:Uncharacterized protein n=1 Tax=Trapa incisa TaxID=236973 RepID=A0AAN7GID0_9MYRT|nr:hypothetical protein SAY87_001326 [Trapa incisa]